MLTNYTDAAKTEAKSLFNKYYGNKYFKNCDYVPYTDPSSILHYLGGQILPVGGTEDIWVMRMHLSRVDGMVVEYNEAYKGVDTLISLAVAHYQLQHLEWDGAPVVYYEWVTSDMTPLQVELASVFVRELFKHNKVEESV